MLNSFRVHSGESRPSHFSDSSPTREELLLFFCILVAGSTRLLRWSFLSGNLAGAESPILYQAATLGFNYFELGPVRRGLGGSIVYLLSDNALLGTAIFYLLSAVAVAAGACLLFARLRAPLLTRATYALVMLAIMMRWAEDAGRTDVAVAALLAFAAHAMARGRSALACAWVGLGVLIHESSVIFGLPLLAALALRHGWRSIPARGWWGGAGVLGFALAAFLVVVWLPQTSPGTMVDVVRSKFSSHPIADWAIYFAVSGARGVQMSICQNLNDPTYWLHVSGGILVIALAAVALSRAPARDWPAIALATLPPFLFLSVVANDFSRWTNLASFNLWLLLISTPQARAGARLPRWLAPMAAVLFLLLSHPLLYGLELQHDLALRFEGDRRIYAGSPVIERIVRKLGAPRTPSFPESLQRCDPTWRDVLDRAPRP